MTAAGCLIKNGQFIWEPGDERRKRNHKIALDFVKVLEGEKTSYSDVKEILSEVDQIAACYSSVSLPASAEI